MELGVRIKDFGMKLFRIKDFSSQLIFIDWLIDWLIVHAGGVGGPEEGEAGCLSEVPHQGWS